MHGDELIQFNIPGLTFRGQETGERIWTTAQGDIVGLFQFRQPPDLPAGAKSISEFADAYRKILGQGAAKLVEMAVVTLDGVQALRRIIKIPQQPSGMTYVGSFTLPFLIGSYVLKIDCQESFPTGIREAVLLERLLQEGESIEQAIANSSNFDAVQFDSEFPQHSLSRLRYALTAIQSSIILDAKIRQLPPFGLPSK